VYRDAPAWQFGAGRSSNFTSLPLVPPRIQPIQLPLRHGRSVAPIAITSYRNNPPALYLRTTRTESMVVDFEQWNASPGIGELAGLEELSGYRVGVEAADYLANRILNSPRAKEPLVPALGGLPLALQQHIEEDLNVFQSLDIEPWFVFSGLDITKHDEPFRQKQEEAAVNANAWNLYDNHQAEASVAKFGESSKTPRATRAALY
jgi:hypothetical protein